MKAYQDTQRCKQEQATLDALPVPVELVPCYYSKGYLRKNIIRVHQNRLSFTNRGSIDPSHPYPRLYLCSGLTPLFYQLVDVRAAFSGDTLRE
jgi:hypothetical protein